MKQQNLYFVGYGDVKELLDTHLPEAPVYCVCIEEATEGNNRFGMNLTQIFVVVSDLKDGSARYVRLPLGKFICLNGEPMVMEEAEKARKRAEAAFALIKNEIRESYFFDIEEALIATPKDFKLLSGGCSFLAYNKETDNFELKNQE